MTDQEASDVLTVKHIEAIQHILIKMLAQSEFNNNVFAFLRQHNLLEKFEGFLLDIEKSKTGVKQ